MPSGSIIFACHSVSSDSRSTSETIAPLQQSEYAAPYSLTRSPQYYSRTTPYGLPSMQSPYYSSRDAPSNSQPTITQIPSQCSSQQGRPSAIIDPSPPMLQYNWSSTGCSSCKATTSSEWRKGPSGKMDLCNAYVFHFRVLMRVFVFSFPI